MLPDPVKMLKDVPGTLHVKVQDVHRAWHDAVLTEVEEARTAENVGFPVIGESDTVYVAAPFDCTEGRLSIMRGSGAISVRRIDGVIAHRIFFAIRLGGEL